MQGQSITNCSGLSLSGNKITNLGTATNGTDAVNKVFLDDSISNLNIATYLKSALAASTYATITNLNSTNTNLSTNYTNNSNLVANYAQNRLSQII